MVILTIIVAVLLAAGVDTRAAYKVCHVYVERYGQA